MAKFKGLLFDLGNTLLHFNGTWPEVFSQADQELYAALAAGGYTLDQESFKTEFRARLNQYYLQREAEFIEHTTAYVLRNLMDELGFGEIPDKIIRPALKKMYAVSQEHWLLEDDCLPTFQTLKQQGYRLGVISNASDDNDVQTLVDDSGIRPYIDFALTSAACGIRKPNPRIFMLGIESWGYSTDEVAMIGDTLGADILGGRNAGIFSIWITRRADTPGNRDHAATIIPDAQIETLAGLIPLLENK